MLGPDDGRRVAELSTHLPVIVRPSQLPLLPGSALFQMVLHDQIGELVQGPIYELFGCKPFLCPQVFPPEFALLIHDRSEVPNRFPYIQPPE